MEAFIGWLMANGGWLWLAIGLLMLAGEMVLPGVYLLWIGLSAMVTAGFAALLPDLGLVWHGLVFVALAAGSIYSANRFFYGRRGEADEARVNRRGGQHVGRVLTVGAPIDNGRGHVQMGDTRWLASGPDTAAGARVRVTAVDGSLLIVEPVEG